jgi:prepilin-type N-terminal cleavage/methylation domain-containing protein
LKTRKQAFTVVELLIAVFVLSIFVFYAYKLFIGGSKIATKAQWINGTTTQLRNAINNINNQLKGTSYPTTLLDDAIQEPGSSTDPSKPYEKFCVQILSEKLGGDYGIEAKSLTAAPKRILTWVMCEPEVVKANQQKNGALTRSSLFFAPSNNIPNIKVGKLILRTRRFSFTTNPAEKYALSGNFASLVHEKPRDYETVIVNDVEEVRITVTNLPPCKDPQPVKVAIKCRWPADPKVVKDASMNMMTNVGLTTIAGGALPGD